MTFKFYRFVCLQCGATRESLQWNYDDAPICCDDSMAPEQPPTMSSFVIDDSIPGGMVLEHVAFKDGKPQRFYSKSEMREAAMKAGWTRYGETPKHSKHREV